MNENDRLKPFNDFLEGSSRIQDSLSSEGSDPLGEVIIPSMLKERLSSIEKLEVKGAELSTAIIAAAVEEYRKGR